MQVRLFIPCYVEHLRPEAGLATARLLDKLGLDWCCPERQTCCGQPAFNAGHRQAGLPAARHFLDRFRGEGDIVSPSGSCTAMVRRYHELPELSDGERDDLRELGAHCFELSDFLVNRLGVTDPGARFPARAAFQDCCHTLRALGLRDEPRRLLAAVKDLELVDQTDTECCGFGGVYSIKVPELSIAQANVRLARLKEDGIDTLIATDVSCLLHIQARADATRQTLRTMHLSEVLAPIGQAAEVMP
ncbi:MAG: (Fe-S)-binding protein [bacterium]|nr:(Fe-S)-binding protein [bacterium]